MPPARITAAVSTYGDHEVINPLNPLRGAITRGTRDGGDDLIARAEKALAEMATNFGDWMNEECVRLDAARIAVKKDGFGKANIERVFCAAHDIKGQAGTFGFPAVAAAADSLCRLVEFTPDRNRIPLQLIDQHVDAIRAIYREYSRSDAKALADVLTTRLREVTDEFLLHENRGNPAAMKALGIAAA